MCARKTFYIFAKSADAQQFCAVRQDQPIPRMIDGVQWRYVNCIDTSRDKLCGFDLDEANEAMRHRGIYFYRRVFTFSRPGDLLRAA
ncbi:MULTISPECIES: hypothetical protein [unclassified Methylobacterium]|jgi:hypothetical protein|uniref:hypothetical protein n=1 Tax=unclassified Methylobacterium TaxID=2615210 RepID=UPI001352D895|nr:hypothetical protein [Methylobacterium sp. 2A]MWV20566.1 hypothetical protein [Methylobacterium sp. 2A]